MRTWEGGLRGCQQRRVMVMDWGKDSLLLRVRNCIAFFRGEDNSHAVSFSSLSVHLTQSILAAQEGDYFAGWFFERWWLTHRWRGVVL